MRASLEFALIGLLRFLIILVVFSFVSFIVGISADYFNYFPPYLNVDAKDFFLNSGVMGLIVFGASILPLIVIFLVLFYLLFLTFSVLGGRSDNN